MDDKLIILTEYVKQSTNRTKVLKTIGINILKPTDITKKTNIHINNVSRSLKQLKEKGLVQILNPESKRGRLYKITEEGKRILKNLK
ncbi:winged helix-turn-helix domain-containing protein [uncultured Methanobrevibacter sp.]|mgnify:CR=1 FL=1|uniref:winged helix-turn-helix domain-containing protein n=1 Tax=uncultured Methanobrevibacter sp. TaxID=253161 RepID=UPI0015BEC6A2|nr:winged helix-turn-helix domain-containing protein [uncultured Methanobrevibacter sp.]